jgi:hypothetical protein
LAERARTTLTLTKRLYTLGYARQDVLDLYAFIDWILALPAELEDQVWAAIQALPEEQRMGYITYAERKGREEGQAALILRMVTQALGEPPSEVRQRIEILDEDQLVLLGLTLGDFTSLNDLETWLATNEQ